MLMNKTIAVRQCDFAECSNENVVYCSVCGIDCCIKHNKQGFCNRCWVELEFALTKLNNLRAAVIAALQKDLRENKVTDSTKAPSADRVSTTRIRESGAPSTECNEKESDDKS